MTGPFLQGRRPAGLGDDAVDGTGVVGHHFAGSDLDEGARQVHVGGELHTHARVVGIGVAGVHPQEVLCGVRIDDGVFDAGVLQRARHLERRIVERGEQHHRRRLGEAVAVVGCEEIEGEVAACRVARDDDL